MTREFQEDIREQKIKEEQEPSGVCHPVEVDRYIHYNLRDRMLLEKLAADDVNDDGLGIGKGSPRYKHFIVAHAYFFQKLNALKDSELKLYTQKFRAGEFDDYPIARDGAWDYLLDQHPDIKAIPTIMVDGEAIDPDDSLRALEERYL